MNADNVPERILMTADTLGGVWTYSLQLASELITRGSEVHLATMGARLSPAQVQQVSSTSGLVVHESSYRLEWMDQPWNDVAGAGRWLLALEREIEPDLIHLNGYAHGALDWKAPAIVVGHSCVLSWWRAVKCEDAPQSWSTYRDAVTRGLRSAACVVAPTRAMLADLHRYYGPFESSAVVPNGLGGSIFGPKPEEPLIFAAGRVWDEAKNLGTLARAAEGLPWQVVVAGDTRHPSGGAQSLPGVRTLGIVDPQEIAAWYARAAIYCLPARYEPFGLSVLEAALSGCALVLGDIPSLRENWEGAAAFVSPGDPRALHHQLRELISNDCRRHAMATAALLRARQFTRERMASAYLATYARAAAMRPAPEFA